MRVLYLSRFLVAIQKDNVVSLLFNGIDIPVCKTVSFETIYVFLFSLFKCPLISIQRLLIEISEHMSIGSNNEIPLE